MGKLEHELRQTKPFGSLRQEAFLGLQRTSDLAARPIEKVFSKWKLTPEQYNVLRILRGSEPDGLPTLEIGRRMITRASNVTRIIDRLELKALVSRKRETHDRRVVRIRVTAQGLKLLTDMQPLVDTATEKALGGLTDNESSRISALLEKIRDGLQR